MTPLELTPLQIRLQESAMRIRTGQLAPKTRLVVIHPGHYALMSNEKIAEYLRRGMIKGTIHGS